MIDRVREATRDRGEGARGVPESEALVAGALPPLAVGFLPESAAMVVGFISSLRALWVLARSCPRLAGGSEGDETRGRGARRYI